MELALLSDEKLPKLDIKVVFFDIDGTLLSLDGNFTQASQLAIESIQSKGINTAIASGRPLFAAKFLIEALNLNGAGSFCAGAHLYEPKSDTNLQVSGLSQTDCLTIVGTLRKLDLRYELYTDRHYFIENDRFKTLSDTHAEHLRVAPSLESFESIIEKQPIVKLLVAVDSKEAHANLYELAKQFPQTHFAFAGMAAHPDWLFASIVDSKACRKQAFEALLQHYNVKAENVMSFGDAHSDMDFLQLAGCGVAMGNAAEQVKSVARFTTKNVWDDGIAYALNRLVLGSH